jgi:hypothetical protein
VGNFHGTYVCPENTWDLRSYYQNPDETLREFIRRFSKECTELSNVIDSNVIGAFIAGTTYRELVHELGRKSPTKASELLDIATNFDTGEEAVGAIFPMPRENRRRTSPRRTLPPTTPRRRRGKASRGSGNTRRTPLSLL